MCKENTEATINKLQEELEAARKQTEFLQERIKKLERLSVTDGLTSLYNQRYFYERLEQEVARNRRQGHPLCLIFFDIDKLKSYNDSQGHSYGDEVLKVVAQNLLKSIRENVDSGYRYGGDEFAIILPEVSSKQAVEIARRISASMQETDFRHVTLSFGIAELGPEIDSKTLFRNADEAMYLAKGRDKDSICIYGD